MPDVSTNPAHGGSRPDQAHPAGLSKQRQRQTGAAWPDRRLADLLQVEHPLVLAPMAGLGTAELAAAVCQAGGLGSIGCAVMRPEAVMQAIGKLRSLTKRPINANFFCHSPARPDPQREQAWLERLEPYYRELGIGLSRPIARTDFPPFGDAVCTVVEACRPEVVSFHFGLPEPSLLARVKAAGCRVLSSATTVGEARWLEERGADAIIAQGFEAGGHRGTFLAADMDAEMARQSGTLALVPQIVDAVAVPVIAAGGIADARAISAAFALGASGVQMGTAYLLCPEAATPPLHRRALRGPDAAATVLTNVFTGRPARALANRVASEVGPISGAMPDFPLPMAALASLRSKAEEGGSIDFTPLWAGQAAALCREMPAGALTQALADEALGRLRQFAGGMGQDRPTASGRHPA